MSIITMGVVVLDCPEPRRLADFYAAVLGWQVDPEQEDGGSWAEIVAADGQRIAFQESQGYVPPQWPGVEHAQQLHLDFRVPRERMDEAEQRVLSLGATLAQGDDGGKRGFRVYLDPVGHPFCLCAADS